MRRVRQFFDLSRIPELGFIKPRLSRSLGVEFGIMIIRSDLRA